MNYKRCFSCKELKSLDHFYLSINGKTGVKYYNCYCKECDRKKCKLYYQKNRLKSLNAKKKRYRENKEKYLDKVREYQVRCIEKVKETRRKSARLMKIKHREKYEARRITKLYIKLGKIKRQPCEICGEIKSEAHHTDYNKPLLIRWLCHKHHRIVEGRFLSPEPPVARGNPPGVTDRPFTSHPSG